MPEEDIAALKARLDSARAELMSKETALKFKERYMEINGQPKKEEAEKKAKKKSSGKASSSAAAPKPEEKAGWFGGTSRRGRRGAGAGADDEDEDEGAEEGAAGGEKGAEGSQKRKSSGEGPEAEDERRRRLWTELKEEDRALIAVGIVFVDSCLSARGPAKMARAAAQSGSNQAAVLKMAPFEDKLFCLWHSLLQALRVVYELLASQPATKNAFVGSVPEFSLKVAGIDNLWPLVGFRFKPENKEEHDAIVVDQFLGLICGKTGKTAPGRQALLEKRLVISDQIVENPYSFAFGLAGRNNWTQKAVLAPSGWCSDKKVLEFVSATRRSSTLRPAAA
eukprot:4018969-Alexandrium_andersonii.AAC.1